MLLPYDSPSFVLPTVPMLTISASYAMSRMDFQHRATTHRRHSNRIGEVDTICLSTMVLSQRAIELLCLRRCDRKFFATCTHLIKASCGQSPVLGKLFIGPACPGSWKTSLAIASRVARISHRTLVSLSCKTAYPPSRSRVLARI